MKQIKYDGESFLQAVNSLLQIPVDSRSGYSSINRIEKALQSNSEVLELENDDFQFLMSQLEYALKARLLNNNKGWQMIVELLDSIK